MVLFEFVAFRFLVENGKLLSSVRVDWHVPSIYYLSLAMGEKGRERSGESE